MHKYSKALADYLSHQLKEIKKSPFHDQPDKIDYALHKRIILEQRLLFCEYIESYGKKFDKLMCKEDKKKSA